MKTAIITGSSGQDGKLLSELLTQKGYQCISIDKKSGVDICNHDSVFKLVSKEKPVEIYHLAAFHHSSEEGVTEDSDFFKKSLAVNFHSLINFLEAIRNHSPTTRIFYAASSHIFGPVSEEVQTESTPINPDSVYAVSKASAVKACHMYRQRYGLFACVGIFYTHESHYRNEKFLSQKIIRAVGDFKSGKRKEKLLIGDLNAVVDWGYAPEYVDAAHRILQLSKPDDFVISTGKPMKIIEFVDQAFSLAGLNWKDFVTERSDILKRKGPVRIGNPEKLTMATGWQPKIYGAELPKILLQSAGILADK